MISNWRKLQKWKDLLFIKQPITKLFPFINIRRLSDIAGENAEAGFEKIGILQQKH